MNFDELTIGVHRVTDHAQDGRTIAGRTRLRMADEIGISRAPGPA